jgi:hypothetical protein
MSDKTAIGRNIFIVLGESDQYETHSWPVAAFPDRGSAEAYAKLARDRAQELSEKFQAAVKAVRNDGEDLFPDLDKFLRRNRFDPAALDFADRYYVVKLPLLNPSSAGEDHKVSR